MDNSQFSEEERAEAYRVESMRHLERQTKALENIKGTLNFFLVVFLVGVVLWLLFVVFASR